MFAPVVGIAPVMPASVASTIGSCLASPVACVTGGVAKGVGNIVGTGITDVVLTPIQHLFTDMAIGFIQAGVFQISSAFSSHFGVVDAGGAQAAMDFAAQLGGVILVVLIPLSMFQIVLHAIQHNVRGMVRTVGKTILAWPATLAAIWVALQLTNAVDQMSLTMVNANSSTFAAKLISPIAGLAGVSIDTSSGSIKQSTSILGFSPTSIPLSLVTMTVGVLIAMLLWLLSFLLTMLLAGRAFALIVMIGFAPLGIIPSMGLDTLASWRKRYLEMVIGLILVAPVIAGVLNISEKIGTTSDSWQSAIMSLVGFLLALLSPRAVLKAVSFAGDTTPMGLGAAGQQVLSRAASIPQQLNSTLDTINGVSKKAQDLMRPDSGDGSPSKNEGSIPVDSPDAIPVEDDAASPGNDENTGSGDPNSPDQSTTTGQDGGPDSADTQTLDPVPGGDQGDSENTGGPSADTGTDTTSPAGPPGSDGNDGTGGPVGDPGTGGTPGNVGSEGAGGPGGANGASGSTGGSGTPGTPGVSGSDGGQGPAGDPGSPGDAGPGSGTNGFEYGAGGDAGGLAGGGAAAAI